MKKFKVDILITGGAGYESHLVKQLLEGKIHTITYGSSKLMNEQIIKDKEFKYVITNWKPKHDDLEFICKTALEWEKKR